MNRLILLYLLFVTPLFGWERTFRFGGYDHRAHDIIQLPNYSILLIGRTYGTSIEGTSSSVILCLQEAEDTLWRMRYGEESSAIFSEVTMIDDTTIVVSGQYGRDTITDGAVNTLMRMNFDGDLLWTRLDTTSLGPTPETSFGGYGCFIDIDYDDNIVSANEHAMAVFSSDGEMLRSDYFETRPHESVYDMKALDHEPYGYITCGIGDGTPSATISCYNTECDTIWVRHYGATDSDILNQVLEISLPAHGCQKGFIAVGSSINNSGQTGVFVVRTDINGVPVWTRTYNHPSFPGSEGFSFGADIVCSDNDSSQAYFTFIGFSYVFSTGEQYAWMMKISDYDMGDTVWTKVFDTYSQVTPRTLTLCHDGGYAAAGEEFTLSFKRFWLCRVDSLGNDVPYAIEETHVSATPFPEQLEVAVFPNPFNSTVEISVTVPDGTDNISVTIYDINGKMIKELASSEGNTFRWDGTDQKGNKCPSGTYIYKVKCDDVEETGSVLFVK